MGTGLVRAVVILVLALGVTACSKFKNYDGPEVTRVIVSKSERRMWLMHGQQPLKVYDINLGFTPVGAKQFEGDGRTPEGSYLIDRRNPNSEYHLSLGIDYPNRQDRERASSMGLSPGGDIFIHGAPKRRSDRNRRDWTAGCIAVSDREMERIYAMVRDGTPIDILP